MNITAEQLPGSRPLPFPEIPKGQTPRPRLKAIDIEINPQASPDHQRIARMYWEDDGYLYPHSA